MRKALRKNALGLTREDLDRTVELARQAAGCALPARLHERRELLGSFLRMGCRRALDCPRHLFDLPALHLFESGADPLRDLAFLALDALQQLALAAAQPF